MPRNLPQCAIIVAKQIPRWARDAIMKGKLVTLVIKITPNIAAAWLEGNTHNRPLTPTKIGRYEYDMKAGKWKLHHQGIAFTSSSILNDGQNRLWAVFNSGATVMSNVTFNEDSDAQEWIDGGTPATRSLVCGWPVTTG